MQNNRVPAERGGAAKMPQLWPEVVAKKSVSKLLPRHPQYSAASRR